MFRFLLAFLCVGSFAFADDSPVLFVRSPRVARQINLANARLLSLEAAQLRKQLELQRGLERLALEEAVRREALTAALLTHHAIQQQQRQLLLQSAGIESYSRLTSPRLLRCGLEGIAARIHY